MQELHDTTAGKDWEMRDVALAPKARAPVSACQRDDRSLQSTVEQLLERSAEAVDGRVPQAHLLGHSVLGTSSAAEELSKTRFHGIWRGG